MGRPVVLVGALDTKGTEYAFVRDQIRSLGVDTLVVDFGVLGEPACTADIPARAVALAGGSTLEKLRAEKNKSQAMEVMSRGLETVVSQLHRDGRLGGIMGMVGGGGMSLVSRAMRQLPVGVPKLLVTTVAGSGDISPFIGTKDITLMPAVVDVAGLNRVSRQIYRNAAMAIAGMVSAPPLEPVDDKPVVCVTMFGNTTQCVSRARLILEDAGYEVLVFHATGTGGRTMEALIESGFMTACLDLTTTELADEICAGVMSAGTERLSAAARAGIPTVLVPGCVDMANFWGADTLPERYRGRLIYSWNPDVTLLRTNAAENEKIGHRIAMAANQACGPVAVLLPLKGVSQLDVPGGPFWDPEADGACFETIRRELRSGIPLIEMDQNVNDPVFAEEAARHMLDLIRVN